MLERPFNSPPQSELALSRLWPAAGNGYQGDVRHNSFCWIGWLQHVHVHRVARMLVQDHSQLVEENDLTKPGHQAAKQSWQIAVCDSCFRNRDKPRNGHR
jgi:hypothetical protein